MKIFCVTGTPGNHLQAVSDILAQAGVARPRPSHTSGAIDMATWHQQVVAGASDGAPVTQPVPPPGKFWEQVASNLFLENLQSPVWGWAMPESVWLLDFWQQFEPNLHFVLVYTSPQRALATALASGVAEDSVGALMDEWQAYHREMLRFHNRNSRRTLLVSADECLASPTALVGACAAKWNLRLADPALDAIDTSSVDPLAMYLVEQLRQTQPQVQALQDEVEASLDALLTESPATHAETSVLDAVQEYRTLRSSAQQAASLSQQYDELTAELAKLAADVTERTASELDSRAEINALRVQYDATRTELDTLAGQGAELRGKAAELEAELARRAGLEAGHKAEIAELKEQATDLKAENDLLLVQLHQVQEELEHLFLKSKELSAGEATKRDTIVRLESELKQQSATVDKLRADLAKKTAELQAKLSEAQAAHDKQVAALTARHAADLKSAANSAAAAATSQELAAIKKKYTELEAAQRASTEKLASQKATLDKANSDLAKASNDLAASKKELDTVRPELAQQKAELETAKKSVDGARKELDKKNIELDKSVRANNEAREESDLLLVQLHQVQEELENYFLKHKDATQQNAALQARWERMLKRNPSYCDFESLTAARVNGDSQHIRWTLSGLNAAGRSFPRMEFETSVDNGITELVIVRDSASKTNAGLYRWPAEFAGQDRLVVSAGNTALLDSLSTSDLAFVRALCTLLISELAPGAQVGAGIAGLDSSVRAMTQEGIEALLAFIDDMPEALRFDQLALRREQVNPDYEHLWLTLESVALADQRWDQFEFRISCANVRPGKFGTHPKLEFPAGAGETPFEKWFDEAYDDFGAKLELRFALPDAMDLSVWSALSEQDHAFIKHLVGALPSMLRQLEQSGVTLRRSFTDWQELASNTQRILEERAPLLNTVLQEPSPVEQSQPAALQVALSKKTRLRAAERQLG